jgi:hypothetical protein
MWGRPAQGAQSRGTQRQVLPQPTRDPSDMHWHSKSTSQERLMMTLRALCFLSTFVCVAAHAQTCSGGAGGGSDATGNQCSAPGTGLDSVPSVAVIAHPAAATPTPMLARASPPGRQSKGAAAPGPQIRAVSPPADRFPVIAKSPVQPVHSTKIANAEEAPCSGGTDGGTDATGNECNSAEPAGSMVLANVRGR